LVKLVEAQWNQTFMTNCVLFPNGAHDDQVDAASAAFRTLIRRVTYYAVAA
jgi:predicted phage terminase large subunit-like protein